MPKELNQAQNGRLSRVEESIEETRADVKDVKDDMKGVKEDVSSIKTEVLLLKQHITSSNESLSTQLTTYQRNVEKDLFQVESKLRERKEDISAVISTQKEHDKAFMEQKLQKARSDRFKGLLFGLLGTGFGVLAKYLVELILKH